MPARIYGSINNINSLNPIPNYFKREHIKETNLGPSHFWGTSARSLNQKSTQNLNFIADWNLYGNVIKTAEDFLQSYKEIGFEKTVQKLNGEFSIALFDDKEKTLYLARDRFGYKPLYYTKNEKGEFSFSSYTSWLLTSSDISPSLNIKNISLFAGAHYRFIDNDRHTSLLNNINQLPASHILKFHNNKIDLINYWKISQEHKVFNASREKEIIQEYRTLFIDAVSQRLENIEGKSCFLLSGGMDSSSVLATATHLTKEKQHAFSTVYTDKTYDESEDIQTILGPCTTTWTPMNIDFPDIFEVVSRMVKDNDGPVATVTWLSHYLLYEHIHDLGYENIFGGLGGDELNAGEFEYFFYYFADLKKRLPPEKLQLEIEKWKEYHDHPIYKKNFDVASLGWTYLTDPTIDGKIQYDFKKYSKYFSALSKDLYDLNNFYPTFPNACDSYLNNKTYSDIFYETIPCCFRANDRHDYTFNLNTQFPFFNHELVEFAYKIPPELKIREGVTKHILREAMVGILPEETRTRVKKTGWNAPFHIWLVQKRNRENLYDLIHSQKFRERGIYNIKEVIKLFTEHEDIVRNDLLQENHMMFFWQLINLESWLNLIEKRVH